MTSGNSTRARSDAAPGFAAAPDAAPAHTIVLPIVHCAGCIRTVEQVLSGKILDALATTAPADVSNVREVAGSGVVGTWNGTSVRFGRGDWLAEAPT